MPAEDVDLLTELRRLHRRKILQTAQWIPRGLERRYAATRLCPLEKAMDAVSHSLAPSTQEMWSRLAQAMPFLLLHMPVAIDDRDSARVPASQPFRARAL